MTLERISENRLTIAGIPVRNLALVFAPTAMVICFVVGCGASKEPVEKVDAGAPAVESTDAAVDLDAGTMAAGEPDVPMSRQADMDASGAGSSSSIAAERTSSTGIQPPANSSVPNSNAAASSSGTNSLTPPADVPQPADLADGLPVYDATNPLEEAAKQAFSSPEKMQRLGKDANLWADPEQKRLVVDGYVAINEGPLEMFACPVGTKEHESVVAVLAQARAVHAGLLAIGADSGTPVSFNPEYRPATGQRIAIWVMWRDSEGNIQKAKAQQWVKDLREDKPLEQDWVFAGSSFWKDPESGREYYQADSGDLVCVSNFSTAMLDLPVESSQSNASLVYVANTDKIPPQGTPVRLVFVPIPIAGEEPKPGAADPAAAPEDELLAAGVK